jgi:CO/xanthine dehydrogenase Mo-binding subunit
MLGLDESQITVHPVELGGGFGGKTTIYLPPIAAMLSKKAGRPVRMVMDRKSVFEATGPAPGGEISVKIGVDADSRIVAATSSIKLEAGAFPGWVAETAAKSVFACYDIENYRVDGYDVLVNKAKANAYRAPGVPQVTFAVESVIDEICERMELDPLEFRIQNSSKEGVRRIDGPRLPRIGVRETFEAAKATDHWNSLLDRNANGLLRGRGIAGSFALFSGRASTVTLNLNPDGTVSLLEGSVDVNGTRTAIAMQVAEVLGVSVYDVIPSVGNTDITGFTEVSHGSRTTYATGWAASKAAENLLEVMRDRVAELWDVDPGVVHIDQGCFSSSEDLSIEIGFKEMAIELMAAGSPLSATGDILRYTAVQDIGTAIHRAQVEGQIQGAVAQGIGWALNEGYLFDDTGQMTNYSFQDYQIPTAVDLPLIEPVLVEVPNPQHPFGVRGAGEVSIGPPTGAIANAIFAATGVRMDQLPMEPGRILAALKHAADTTE